MELDRTGVPIDLAELKLQHLEDLIEHLDDPGSKTSAASDAAARRA